MRARGGAIRNVDPHLARHRISRFPVGTRAQSGGHLTTWADHQEVLWAAAH